jgi:calcium-dependent protein kinase
MGIEYGEKTENLNNNNKGLLDPNYKGPSFYLNKNYPNDDNLTLEEILRQYLEVKNYSFNNNNEIINNQIEENSLTPKFNTKNDRTNIKALNISTNPNNDQKEDDQIININKNSLIKDNESNIIPNINNSNININININIDLPKNKKSQSIIKTLQNSYQENNIKSKKSKTKEQKAVKFSSPNKNELIHINNLNNIRTNKTKDFKLNLMEQITKIQMKPSSLMKDIRKEFKFLKPLGGGHFGTVRKAFRRSDKEPYHYFAIKSISIKNMTQKDYDDLVKEVDIISGLDHPNIIKFYETYHDECFFHIVMELCKGKEVFDNICNHGYLRENKVQNIIFKVLLAIAHCHSRGITHRDLKPENILFESLKADAEIKLIDFGLSRKYSKDEKMHTILGTPYYVAPEVLKGNYDEKCDIWSIGAMTYLMLCGDPPFTGDSNNEIFKKIVKGELKFNLYKWKNISEDAKDFVKLCLNKNAAQRPSATEAISHRWFKYVTSKIHDLKNIPLKILENIKNFDVDDKFKQMILKYMINNINREEVMSSYKNAYYAMDINHNGWIEVSEFKKIFKLSKINISEEKINHIYNIIDQTKKGGIDYTEFLMAGINKNELITKNNLENAFNYFDANKSEFIEVEDLEETLLKMGKECTEPGGIKSIIQHFLLSSKDKEENNNSNQDIFYLDDKEYKISKSDFFKNFGIL